MDKMEIKRILEINDLTDKEIKIYLTLLRLGSERVGEISKVCQINRTTAYDILRGLLDKGLVSYIIKDNKKWFQPANPKILLEILEHKKEDTKRIIPDLLQIYKAPKEKSMVRLFYGKKGVKSVFQDMVREGGPHYVLDWGGPLIRLMPYYAPQFIKQIEKKKIKIKHIVKKGVDIKPTKTTQVRYLESDKPPEPALAVTTIYKNKVAIVIWSDPPQAIIIRGKETSDIFKIYFDILWETAKP